MKQQRFFSLSALILLIILVSGCDPAHYNLKGHIYHQIHNTEAPVSAANVNLECPMLRDKMTESDVNGNFVVEGIGYLDTAECVIHVKHPDYDSKEIIIEKEHLVGEKNLSPDYSVRIELDNKLE